MIRVSLLPETVALNWSVCPATIWLYDGEILTATEAEAPAWDKNRMPAQHATMPVPMPVFLRMSILPCLCNFRDLRFCRLNPLILVFRLKGDFPDTISCISKSVRL